MTIAEVQAAYRRNLVATWQIPGSIVILEVGCGQGDMTVALAEAVGPSGKVVAVDAGRPDYGAPETLKQATDAIKAGPLGDRVEFWFDFDLRNPPKEFEATPFDIAVLAHCSWYFPSEDVLRETLIAARRRSARLLLAEWDRTVHQPEQRAHAVAIDILEHTERGRVGSEANVRCPLRSDELRRVIEDAGWSIRREQRVATDGMQDADWEIAFAREAGAGLPLLAELEALAQPSGNISLDAVLFDAI